MAEPVSSTVLSSPLAKLFFFVVPPTLAAIVVMIVMRPKSNAEWFPILTSSVASSFALGTYIVKDILGIAELKTTFEVVEIGGILFLSALPGWVLVRAWFLFAEHSKNKTLIEMIGEIRKAIKGESE